MSDIILTINGESRKYDLMKGQYGNKSWMVSEEQLVQPKAVSTLSAPSYENLPPERLLVFEQSSWQGGMGAELYRDIADKFYNGESIDCRERNRIYLAPFVNQVGNTVDYAPHNFIQFGGSIYFSAYNKVYKIETDLSLTLKLTLSEDYVTDLYVYGAYFLVACYAGNYFYSTDGNNYTQHSENGFHHFCAVPNNENARDVLCGSAGCAVLTTIDPTNDGEWSSQPYYVGNYGYAINDMICFNNQLFIGKWDGLYTINSDGNIEAVLPEFNSKPYFHSFSQMTIWESCLYMQIGEDIAELTARYDFQYISPAIMFPELNIRSYITAVASSERNLFVAILDQNTNTSTIYIGRERTDEVYGLRWEWSPFVKLSNTTCEGMAAIRNSVGTTSLWFGHGTYVQYVEVPESPKSMQGVYDYSYSGNFTTSYFDAQYPTWQKLFHRLYVELEGMVEATNNILVEYQCDISDVWLPLGTFTENGLSYVDFHDVIPCKRIRLKFTFTTTSTGYSPVLKRFILRGVLQPETIRTLDFTVVLDDTQSRKPSNDLAFLESGRGATEFITLEDTRFRTSRKVIFLPGTPTETEVFDEVNKQPIYGARVLAEVMEWNPE